MTYRRRPPYRTRDPISGMPVYCERNGVVLGFLQGSVLHRYIKSYHQQHDPPSWTVDADAMDKLRANYDVSKIMIDCMDNGLRFSISIEDWDEHRGELDRGKGRQYFVRLKWWKTWRC